MSIHTNREQRRALARENARRPLELEEVPADEWPLVMRSAVAGPIRVLRSRHFLVQVFAGEGPVVARLSVNRTELTGDRWSDNIAWDELQALKGQSGYPNQDAVEVYPRSGDVVNVANMRHLWVMREPLPFAWRRS